MALNFLSDSYFAGKVGIGTTNPQAALHVTGTTRIDGILFNRDVNAGYYSSTADLTLRSGTSGRTLINPSGGNVGIGVPDPQAKLEVMGASATPADGNEIISVTNTTGGSKLLLGVVENNYGWIQSAEGGTLRNLLLNPNGGNVGIGTTTPVARLQVHNISNSYNQSSIIRMGTETTNNFAAEIGFFRGTSSDVDRGLFLNATGSGQSSQQVKLLLNGNFGIGTTTPNAKLEVDVPTYNANNAIANFINGNNPNRVAYDTVVVAQQDVPCLSIVETPSGAQATEQKLTFAVGDGSAVIGSTSTATNGIYINTNRATSNEGYNPAFGTNVARFLNNGNVVFPGNVGIATSTPGQKLQVEGNAWIKGIYYDTSGDAGSSGQILSSTASGTNWISGSAIPGVPGGSGTTNFLARWTPDGDTLGIGITFDNGTSVGIGTVTPDSTFHVKGISSFEEVTAGAGTQLKIIGQDSSGQFNFLIGKQFNVNNAFEITPSTVANGGVFTNPALIIKETGNVGIGVTGPTQALVVSDSNNYKGILVRGSVAPNIGFVQNAGSTPTWKAGLSGNDGSAFSISSGAVETDRLIIKSNGNVGIGTISPNTKLDVNGVVVIAPNTDGKQTFEFTTNASNDARLLMKSDTTVKVDIQANGDSYFNGGDVGIGTTSPNSMLTVWDNAGTFNARESGVNVHRPNSYGQYGSFSYDGGTTFFASTYTGNGVNDYGAYLFQQYNSTSTPQECLEIGSDGDLRFRQYSGTQQVGTPTYILGTNSSGNVVKVLGADIPGSVSGSGTLRTIPMWTPDGDTLGNSVLKQDVANQNIGLGITPETGMVTYVAQLRIGEQSALQGHTDGVGQDSFTCVTTNYKFGTSGSVFINGTVAAPGFANIYQQQLGDHSFGCSTTTGVAGGAITVRSQMVIKQAGQVGIGTTTPGTLHGSAYGYTPLHVDGGTDRGQMILEGDSLAAIIFSDNGATANSRVFATAVDNGDYQIKPLSDNGSSTAKGAAITVLHGGGVGISTITPDGNLEVDANILVSGASDSVNNVLIGLQSANRPTIILDTADTTYTNRTWNITNVGSAGKLFIGRNGLDVMVMDNAGKVGIGITGPESKLHVDADEVVLGTVITDYRDLAIQVSTPQETANSGTGISFDHGALGAAIASARINNSTWGTDLRFYTHPDATTNQRNVTERMRIIASGNVGIGTDSPGHKLVSSVASGNYSVVGQTVSGGQVGIYNSTGDNGIGTINNYAFNLFTNNSAPQVTVATSGNVGIGVTGPASKLQVAGGIQMADDTDAGTTAAKAGTMRYRTGTEYVEVTGTNIVTNGDFLSSPASSGWTTGSGWTITTGNATWNAAATYNWISSSVGTVVGNIYRVSFDCVVTSGNLYVVLGNGGETPSITATGSYEFILTPTGGGSYDTLIRVYQTAANSNFSITNISATQVTAEDASYADMCMQTGASTYEWVNIVRNTY